MGLYNLATRVWKHLGAHGGFRLWFFGVPEQIKAQPSFNPSFEIPATITDVVPNSQLRDVF